MSNVIKCQTELIITPVEPRIEVLCAFCDQLRIILKMINRIANLPTAIAFKANNFNFIMKNGISIVWITNGIKRRGKNLFLNEFFFFLCLPKGFFFLRGLWISWPFSLSTVIKKKKTNKTYCNIIEQMI